MSTHAGALGPLRFVSTNLAGRGLVRIVEEELIAVRITDHQEPVATRSRHYRILEGVRMARPLQFLSYNILKSL